MSPLDDGGFEVFLLGLICAFDVSLQGVVAVRGGMVTIAFDRGTVLYRRHWARWAQKATVLSHVTQRDLDGFESRDSERLGQFSRVVYRCLATMANCEQFTLQEVHIEQKFIKETLKILIHAIVFQRALGENKTLDAESDIFDLSYLRCQSKLVQQQIENHAHQFHHAVQFDTIQNIQQSRPLTQHDDFRLQMKICIAFFERRQKNGAFGLFRTEERVVWERWVIPLSIFLRNDTEPAIGSSAETARKREIETELRDRLEYVLTSASERRDHIPPADGLGGSHPWFEITSSSSAESSGVLDLFKKMILSSPPNLLPGSGAE